jgi:hypothetical protein
VVLILILPFLLTPPIVKENYSFLPKLLFFPNNLKNMKREISGFLKKKIVK